MLLIITCGFQFVISDIFLFISDMWDLFHFIFVFLLFLIIISELDMVKNLDSENIKPGWKPFFNWFENYYDAIKEINTSVFVALPITFSYFKSSIAKLSIVINSYILLISAIVIYIVCMIGTTIKVETFIKSGKCYIRRLLIVICWACIIISILCIMVKGVLSNIVEEFICYLFIIVSLIGLYGLYKTWIK